jgi:eukaryotic-like serine/threonine-protein kinase
MVHAGQSWDEFRGTARFAVRRTLGSGGMGVVYHAYDRVRGMDVALKTLRYLDADAIYRLKKEFRSLAEFHHPNLVTLMELISEGELWFFTMELVRGVTFLEHVTSPSQQKHPQTVEISANTVPLRQPLEDESSTLSDRDLGDLEDEEVSSEDPLDSTDVSTTLRVVWGEPSSGPTQRIVGLPSGPPPANVPLLKTAFRQLVDGLGALHALGKLHRDIKPSNVLVTAAGRVVILDFGLVTELFPDTRGSGTDHSLAGTVAYMAPETGSEAPLTPAADWYAVGVMLYEALTGRLPFPGSGVDVLLRKQREDPPPPSHLVSNVPRELDQLCVALLSRDPLKRPSPEEILRRIGAPARSASIVPSGPSLPQRGPFIGRHRHLIALDAAFASTQRGRPVALYVRGASGIGKTALVRHFIEDLRDRADALVLTGKCYERETVPFKALDSLIDSLSRYLSKLDRDELTEILPRSIRALAKIFPVLLRIEAVERAPKLPAETPDQQELRRRAFQALRELLGKIAEKRPVVLFIDDLQWGDSDSAAMLIDLLRPPLAPPVLLVFSYRSDEEAESPLLQKMLLARMEHGADVRVVTVGALTKEEARDLALTLLHQHEARPDEHAADRIAEESEGNPFFIDALVRDAQKPGREGSTTDEISLDRVLLNRLSRLTKPSRRMLDLIAVAGRPLPVEVAVMATGTGAQQEPTIVATLRASNLIRSLPGPNGDMLETFHDRIRDSVLTQLPPDQLQERHRALAFALESASSPNIEALFFHFREAGEIDRAARYAALAAEHAAASLAFDRAARLFQVALEIVQDENERRRLHTRMGDSLSNAGRCAEAAESYLEAAKGRSDLEALELRRRGAEQLLISGRIDPGLDQLRDVLAAFGFKLASSKRGAYLSRVLRRGKVWRRGFDFVERPLSEIAPEDLMRIDVLWTTVVGLVLVDYIRGADFQSRHVLLALECGEPYRIARAVALEACYVATGGGKGQWRTAKLIEVAAELARKLDHPHAIGLASLAEGAGTYFEGHWARARLLLERTEEIFRDRCSGVTWETTAARLLLHGSLFQLGQIAVLAKRLPLLIDEAELRGDLFASAIYRFHSASVYCAADNPERGLRQVDEAVERWSKSDYHLQHALALGAKGQLLLYQGRAADALAQLEGDRESLEDSYLLKTQTLRVENLYLRARILIALAREDPKRKKTALAAAAKDAEGIEKEGMRWATPLSKLVNAAIAEHRGDADTARREYEGAISSLVAAGMAMKAACARLRLGDVIGGDEGRALTNLALDTMAEQNVREPRRFADALVPVGVKPS